MKISFAIFSCQLVLVLSHSIGSAENNEGTTLQVKNLNASKFTPVEMCQWLNEYVGVNKNQNVTVTDCIRKNLRLEDLNNSLECHENPSQENSVFLPENSAKFLLIALANSVCDEEHLKRKAQASMTKMIPIFRKTVKPNHLDCLKYKLREIDAESPLLRDFDELTSQFSSANTSSEHSRRKLLIKCCNRTRKFSTSSTFLDALTENC